MFEAFGTTSLIETREAVGARRVPVGAARFSFADCGARRHGADTSSYDNLVAARCLTSDIESLRRIPPDRRPKPSHRTCRSSKAEQVAERLGAPPTTARRRDGRSSFLSARELG